MPKIVIKLSENSYTQSALNYETRILTFKLTCTHKLREFLNTHNLLRTREFRVYWIIRYLTGHFLFNVHMCTCVIPTYVVLVSTQTQILERFFRPKIF